MFSRGKEMQRKNTILIVIRVKSLNAFLFSFFKLEKDNKNQF